MTLTRTLALPAEPGADTFTGGLATSPDGKTLYATRVFSMTVSSIDLASGRVLKTVALPAEPYTCVVSADGRRLFVSIWGGSIVLVLDAETLGQVAYLPVGEHPNAMALSVDGKQRPTPSTPRDTPSPTTPSCSAIPMSIFPTH